MTPTFSKKGLNSGSLSEKFFSLAVILAISLVGALLPVISPKVSRLIRSYERELRMFSGDVFVAVALIDLEPEANESLRALSTTLPLAQCTLGGTFVALLILDRLVSSRRENNHDRHASPSLTFGLILNALFDGVALGAQSTQKSVWSRCLGISAHKGLEVFMFSTGLSDSVKVKYSALFRHHPNRTSGWAFCLGTGFRPECPCRNGGDQRFIFITFNYRGGNSGGARAASRSWTRPSSRGWSRREGGWRSAGSRLGPYTEYLSSLVPRRSPSRQRERRRTRGRRQQREGSRPSY